MSLFPKIARPCPYIDRLDTVIADDFCRMCKRTVHDLTDMDDRERAAFLTACGGDACVSYIAYVRPAIAAALVAASTAALVMPDPAMAQRHRSRHVPQVEQPRYVAVALAGAPPVQPPVVVVPVVLAGEPVPADPPKPPEAVTPPAIKPD